MGENLKEQVRERYAGAARDLRDVVSGKASCASRLVFCGSDVGALEADVSGGSYSQAELPRLAVDPSSYAATR